MYRHLERQLAQRILEILQRRHPGVTLPRVVIEQPPKVELGDFAIPTFPFAKPLRSAPLKIAEEIRGEAGSIEGIAGMQVAPPGYLNVSIDRSWLAAAFLIAVVLPFLLFRVLNEDRVLQSRLDGYADYARRVRWRLLPGLW